MHSTSGAICWDTGIGWFVAIALFAENGYSYWKDRRERAQNVCCQQPMVEEGKKPMGSELR